MPATSRVRIIGGQWRGRFLEFAGLPGLRPTGDRIRETLFNWLQFSIAGARCLDLYAGSGALGIEALSRGASSATLVESQVAVVNCLRSQALRLETKNLHVVHAQALDFLRRGEAHWGEGDGTADGFDLVFIDPPFEQQSQLQTLQACIDHAALNPGAKLYLEAPVNKAPELSLETQVQETFAQQVEITKSNRSGQVQYLLLTYLG